MNLQFLLATSLISYVVLMFAVSIYAQRKVNTVEDFVVAGRRLPVWMASATLLATWFGAGPVLTASTEVANFGVYKAALDPIGAGFCLVIAGFFFASKMWEQKILTVCDFFRNTFGTKAEIASAVILIPSYFGWIAAQFVALAHVLNYFFDIPIITCITLIFLVGTFYTILGGMWSVTLTDTIQVSSIILGLFILFIQVFISIGAGDFFTGVNTMIADLKLNSAEKLNIIHADKDGGILMWVSVIAAGALGNVPGQDLMQRIFSAKSAACAKAACLIAGISYLILGTLTVSLGLAGSYLFKGETFSSVLPHIASHILTPIPATIFMLAIVSAVLSTIDSAILAPATVLAQNLLSKIPQNKISSLALNRLSILFIGGASFLLAISGEGAYALLEDAYSLTMAGLFVPLTMGLWAKSTSEKAALTAMFTGFSIWLCHTIFNWKFFLEPLESVGSLKLSPPLMATITALTGFLLVQYLTSQRFKKS